MRNLRKHIFLLSGLLLLLTAFPVFAQNEPVKEIEINKRPLEDFRESLKRKFENKEVDLSKPFLVEMQGALTKEGCLDATKSIFTKTEGDAGMVEVAKDGILAFSDSGFFFYLRQMNVENLKITYTQDQTNFKALIETDHKTPERAITNASVLSTLLKMLQFADRNGTKKLDENSKILVNNTTVSSKDKITTINFSLPREEWQALLLRLVNREKEKAASSVNE